MRTRTMREWKYLYVTYWRDAFAHLPKPERAKLVRGCRGKAIYESHEEAQRVIARLTLRPGELLGAYDCPLCSGIHTGNRKYLNWNSAPLRADQKMQRQSCRTPTQALVTVRKKWHKSGAMDFLERTW
ncbi:MAG: hypothetical protein WB561_01925 [Terracidiphilus sp.]